MEILLMRLYKHTIIAAIALFLAVFASACSSKPFLKVQYQLPSTSATMEGKAVSLAVADTRNSDIFLSQTAKKSLKDFNGTFSLVVLRQDGSGNLVGAYEVKSLLREIFKQRLENMGLQVIPVADTADPTLEIQLKEFKLDLANRKWIISMRYQASLTKIGNPTAKESVDGMAERLKVMGKSEAEKIIGELLTDMVNKFDLVKLFQKAQQ